MLEGWSAPSGEENESGRSLLADSGAVLWGILASELGSIDGEAFAGSRPGP